MDQLLDDEGEDDGKCGDKSTQPWGLSNTQDYVLAQGTLGVAQGAPTMIPVVREMAGDFDLSGTESGSIESSQEEFGVGKDGV